MKEHLSYRALADINNITVSQQIALREAGGSRFSVSRRRILPSSPVCLCSSHLSRHMLISVA